MFTFEAGEGRGLLTGRLVGDGEVGQAEVAPVVLVQITCWLGTQEENQRGPLTTSSPPTHEAEDLLCTSLYYNEHRPERWRGDWYAAHTKHI